MSPTAARPGRLRTLLSGDVLAGALLIGAASLGFGWANSPWRESFHALTGVVIGPEGLGLDLSVAAWVSDGVLAIFFFVVGLELKHEFVAGGLRTPRVAGVPILAALGGMVVPAVVYASVLSWLGEPEALHGWAIPTATDIAFALAVLALFGRGLPSALRLFLLTLAVVDDLLAITVIAIFYTEQVSVVDLVAAGLAVGAFAVVIRLRAATAWLLVPIAVTAWVFLHASGVHATIAGVLLGLSVPAARLHKEPLPRTTVLEHRFRPWSAVVALPLFAFVAAGVTIIEGPGAVLTQPVVLAVVAGLVVGKVVGVLGTTAVVTRFTGLRLPQGIGLRDLLPIGFLAGIGFTVSLLIAELSFADSAHAGGARVAVLMGTLLSALLAAALLRWDARKVRDPDMFRDGVVDPPPELIE